MKLQFLPVFALFLQNHINISSKKIEESRTSDPKVVLECLYSLYKSHLEESDMSDCNPVLTKDEKESILSVLTDLIAIKSVKGKPGSIRTLR